MAKLIAVVLLGGALACREPATAPPPFEPVLSDRELWSGGELQLIEAAFAHADAIVIVGADTLVPQHVDDTTLVVRLPVRSGEFPLRVVAGPVAASLGNIHLHGFEGVTEGPSMSGQPYWIPAGAPLVFAAADPGAAIVDLRTGSRVVSLPDSVYSPDCVQSVGPTRIVNQFVLIGRSPSGQCGLPKLWSVSSNPLLLDSVQVAGDNDWYTTGQPTDRRWVFNNNNHNLFFSCDSVPCRETFFLSPDGPEGVTIAPTGNRFLWLPAVDAVVYDSRTFDTAYVVPAFNNVHGTFSPDGDTLVLAADVYIPPFPSLHIVAVRASDGAVLHDLSLDSLRQSIGYQTLSAVAFDRERPLLYATAVRYSFADSLYHLRLIVLDRRTWTIVGMAEGVGGRAGSVAAIVPSPVEHLVYVVSAFQGYNVHGSRASIWRFSTP